MPKKRSEAVNRITGLICLVFLVCFSAIELWVIGHELVDGRNAEKSWQMDLLRLSRQADAKPVLMKNVSARIERLQQAVMANPWDTQATLHLSQELEAQGDLSGAEKQLEWASSHDNGAAPKWATANFYMRRGDKERFFDWANRYRQTAAQPNKGLFRLMLESEPDMDKLLPRIRPINCAELIELIGLLDERGDPTDHSIGDMARCTDSDSENHWAAHVSFLLDRDLPLLAKSQWERLGFSENLFNPDFRSIISEKGFDWRLNHSPGISVLQHQGQSGLYIDAAPETPDGAVVLFQPVVLVPRAAYKVAVHSETDGGSIVPLRLELVALSQGKVLASNMDGPRGLPGEPIEWTFHAPDSGKALALALIFRRPGTVAVQDQIIRLNAVDLTPVR